MEESYKDYESKTGIAFYNVEQTCSPDCGKITNCGLASSGGERLWNTEIRKEWWYSSRIHTKRKDPEAFFSLRSTKLSG